MWRRLWPVNWVPRMPEGQSRLSLLLREIFRLSFASVAFDKAKTS